MTKNIPALDRDASQSELLATIDEYGAVVLKDFLEPAVVASLNQEFDALLAAQADKQQRYANAQVAEFFGGNVTHLAGIAGKSPTFVANVLCHPLYMSLCDHILHPVCDDYQLNIAHMMQREPGSEAQFLHRDDWVWKRLPRGMGEVQLASMVALDNFTSDNGATLVVPGSHGWSDERYPEPGEVVSAAMTKGSALVYLGSTFHGGGANVTSNSRRRGIHISFTAGWLRTEENQCLATPLDVVREMPLRAQQLLGFGLHDDIKIGGGYLGTVELGPAHDLLGDAT